MQTTIDPTDNLETTKFFSGDDKDNKHNSRTMRNRLASDLKRLMEEGEEHLATTSTEEKGINTVGHMRDVHSNRVKKGKMLFSEKRRMEKKKKLVKRLKRLNK